LLYLYLKKKEKICLESTHTNVPIPLKWSGEWDEENVIIIIFFFFASDSTGDTSFIKIHHFFPYIN
jgi:hypothetical protein